MWTVTALVSPPYQKLSDTLDRWRVDVMASDGVEETKITLLYPEGDTGRHMAKQLEVGEQFN